MKRIIKNIDAASASEKSLIREQYPLGIEDSDLLNLQLAGGKFMTVLEVFTPEAICLLRMCPEVRAELDEMDWDEVDEAALAEELAEQTLMRAAEAQAEALETAEMTVELDEEEEQL